MKKCHNQAQKKENRALFSNVICAKIHHPSELANFRWRFHSNFEIGGDVEDLEEGFEIGGGLEDLEEKNFNFGGDFFKAFQFTINKAHVH